MLTDKDLDQIADAFGLNRLDKIPVEDGSRPIKDGRVRLGDRIWWRGEYGPMQVTADRVNWDNILDFPELYSHAKPKTKLVYED